MIYSKHPELRNAVCSAKQIEINFLVDFLCREYSFKDDWTK